MARILLPIYFALVALYLLFPLLVVVPISFVDSRFLQFPPEALSLRWYRNYFEDPDFLDATIFSFMIGVPSCLIATTLGTLAALGMTRTRFFGKGVIYALMISPIIVPVIIVSLALYIFFARLDLIGSPFGLILAHSILAMPFSVLIVSATLEHFDVTLERAARVLGAGPIRTFWHVTFPAIRPAVLASAIFGFFISFDELIVALFVMGRRQTLPVRIWQDLRFEIDPTVAAVASLLIALTAVGIGFGAMFQMRATRRLKQR
jgi:putative spermidine/putrescine transport system permease protein